MNFRLTAILFGVLLVITLVLIGVTFLDDTPTAGGLALEELTVAGVKPDQIDTIEIERTEPPGKIVLVRVDKDRWELREPMKAKAETMVVEGLAASLLAAKPVPTSETSHSLGELGLQPPSLRVTLRKGSEQAGTLNLGKVTLGDARALVFATTAAHPERAMALRRADVDPLFTEAARKSAGEPAAAFAKTATEWRALRPLGTDPRMQGPPVASLTISTKDKSITLARKNEAEPWKIEKPDLGAADAIGEEAPTANRFTGVQSLLSAITNLNAISAKDVIEAPKDLKEFGLDPDNPKRVTIVLKLADGKTETAYIGKKDEKEPGYVYMQVQGDSGVFKVQSPNSDGFAAAAADPASLRDRNLLDVDRMRIDAIDLTVNGQTAKLRRGPGGWTLFGGPNDPQSASMQRVDNILALLTERRTIRDYTAANDANFAPAEVKADVKLYADLGPLTDAAKKTDLKDQKPTVLLFGKTEGDAIRVRRVKPDGSKTDLLIPATMLVGSGKTPVEVLSTLTQTRLDLLDPRLKSFSTALANRLTFTRAGTETIEVVKMGVADPQYPEGRWEFVQPPSLKGQPANTGEVDQLLQLLSTTTASRFVAEQPTEQQLAEWGLDPKSPKLKVKVDLASKEDPARNYDFGNDTADKAFVYARMLPRTDVFLVSKATPARFNGTPELRDRTLVAFDLARLKGMKLRGWHADNKPPTTIELEHKDKTWTAKAAPMGFAIDSAKVAKLVDALRHAHVTAFLGPIKPEYGFGVEAQNGLEITLELEGLPPIVITLGAPADEGKTFDVFCSQRPGEAVTVAAEPFKDLKEKPESLAKPATP